jgi:8-oxo-dGTP pyrophosphatase MutT (NUDIX family)
MRMQPDIDRFLRLARQRLAPAAPDVRAAGGRPAAVLVPLLPVADTLHLLFTVRPLTMPTHAGDICFPGGSLRAGEDARAAALREAHEEVGLSPESIAPLGFLPLRKAGSGHVIAPLVGLVRRGAALTPCPREVAEVFTAPLAHFLDADNYAREDIDVGGRRRAYWVVRWRQRRIWGATAGMLKTLQEMASADAA